MFTKREVVLLLPGAVAVVLFGWLSIALFLASGPAR